MSSTAIPTIKIIKTSKSIKKTHGIRIDVQHCHTDDRTHILVVKLQAPRERQPRFLQVAQFVETVTHSQPHIGCKIKIIKIPKTTPINFL